MCETVSGLSVLLISISVFCPGIHLVSFQFVVEHGTADVKMCLPIRVIS